jgi:diguanylate cyclase (GGDEF)-like protein
MRLLTSFTSPLASNAEFFDKSVFQLVYITSFAVCILLFSIGVVLMATERLRTELEHLVTHDALTSALTRRRMNDACERELERCRRHGHSMALLMMDLDHFKAINDTYGHQAGDRVLVSFVSKVKTLLRSADSLGRFGGEEFIAVLPETTLEEAIAVAERILQISIPSDQAPSCTVSIGITTNHKDSDTADTLLARADNAMYRAKARGRNRLETA